MQASWQDLKAFERWGFMYPAGLYQHPPLYQCTHRGKIHSIHAAVAFEVQGKNPLLCLIYFRLPCSEPISPKTLLLLVTSSWSRCIYRCSPHCLKQEQTQRDLLWKAAWVMFRWTDAVEWDLPTLSLDTLRPGTGNSDLYKGKWGWILSASKAVGIKIQGWA